MKIHQDFGNIFWSTIREIQWSALEWAHVNVVRRLHTAFLGNTTLPSLMVLFTPKWRSLLSIETILWNPSEPDILLIWVYGRWKGKRGSMLIERKWSNQKLFAKGNILHLLQQKLHSR